MIFLNIGEPDFTAPPLVQEAAAKAACATVATQYTNALGLDALRERISQWYPSRFGVEVSGAAHCGYGWRHRLRCTWPAWP